MRTGLLFVTFFILYRKNLNCYIIAVRLHDFYFITYRELVLLLDVGYIVLSLSTVPRYMYSLTYVFES